MATLIGGGDATPGGGLQIPPHDYYINTWTGSNLTKTVYKVGGASGKVVATVEFTYDTDKLLTATRT